MIGNRRGNGVLFSLGLALCGIAAVSACGHVEGDAGSAGAGAGSAAGGQASGGVGGNHSAAGTLGGGALGGGAQNAGGEAGASGAMSVGGAGGGASASGSAGEGGEGGAPIDLDHWVLELAAGDHHVCARSYTGVKSWGANEHGQLGYGNTENIGDDELPSAVGFVQLPEGADHVWANGNHSCVTSLGKVTCWGSNDDGELCYGNTENIGDDELPTAAGTVSLGSGSIGNSLAASEHDTCVIQSTNSVRCWGLGSTGALGLGNYDSIGDDELPSSVPPVALPSSAFLVNQIVAGDAHTCVLSQDKVDTQTQDLTCWGSATEALATARRAQSMAQPAARSPFPKRRASRAWRSLRTNERLV